MVTKIFVPTNRLASSEVPAYEKRQSHFIYSLFVYHGVHLYTKILLKVHVFLFATLISNTRHQAEIGKKLSKSYSSEIEVFDKNI